jgi:hypothetical protein
MINISYKCGGKEEEKCEISIGYLSNMGFDLSSVGFDLSKFFD